MPEEGRIGIHFGELVDAYSALSNELTVPKVLVCPTDTKQRATGCEVLHKKVEWDRSLHQERGHLALSGGSVMALGSQRLSATLANGVIDTNLLRARLVVPTQ